MKKCERNLKATKKTYGIQTLIKYCCNSKKYAFERENLRFPVPECGALGFGLKMIC
jgi:hypothetical protein